MTEQPETDEQRADRLETERAHAAGDHQYCGATCEVEFPSEMLRNTILFRAIPGSAGMLDELLRRAALTPPTDQPTSDSLRELYAAAIDAKVDGTAGCANGHRLADAILAVRDREMEQLRADLKRVQERACSSAENLRNEKGRVVKAEADIAHVEDIATRWEKYGSTDLRTAARIPRAEVLDQAQEPSGE